MKAYRLIFLLAALYNLAFGLWAAAFPFSYFRAFDLPEPRYPSIWACLGMVVGLYGLVYLLIAWEPERGTWLALIGLAGKIFGPIGWVLTVWRGDELPPRTVLLILANDLIWWFPFLYYLLRDSPRRGQVIAAACVAVHLAACLLLVLAAGGTEMNAHLLARQQWIIAHTGLWVCTWVTWMLASLSLLAYCIAWAQRLVREGARPAWLWSGCGLIAVGLIGDLCGEWVNIAHLTAPGLSLAEFTRGARFYALASAGFANGMYCIGGLALSTAAWRVRFLRGFPAALGFAMWSAGLLLTVAAVLDIRQMIVITGAAVMGMFVPWAAWVGRQF